MTEKLTDTLMLNAYKEAFNRFYHTEGNTQLFKQFKPDGWDIIGENILVIIENKHEVSAQAVKQAIKQLIGYYKLLSDDDKQRYTTYLVVGVGEGPTFSYCIYNTRLQRTNLMFSDLAKQTTRLDTTSAYNIASEIHSVNQIIYNELALQKQQKTLFIASILICLKIDSNFLNNYSDSTIADKIIETIDNYYSDKPFTNIFKFMSKTIKIRLLYQ